MLRNSTLFSNFARMKTTILTIALGLSLTCQAQNVWEKPETESETKTVEAPKKAEAPKVLRDAKYLAGAVTEVDGKVTWTLDADVPGKSAQQIYDKVMEYMTRLTHESNQLEGSQVSLINKQDHIIVTNVREWLVFKKNAIMLDRTKLRYNLITTCSDGHVKMVMSNITYKYEEDRYKDKSVIRAEDWIVDKYAMNKKATRLYPVSGKFRRKTVDRKDFLFKDLVEYLNDKKTTKE